MVLILLRKRGSARSMMSRCTFSSWLCSFPLSILCIEMESHKEGNFGNSGIGGPWCSVLLLCYFHIMNHYLDVLSLNNFVYILILFVVNGGFKNVDWIKGCRMESTNVSIGNPILLFCAIIHFFCENALNLVLCWILSSTYALLLIPCLFLC